MQGSPFTLFKLEYWIRSCIRGHCFGCSLRPATPLNSPCKLASSVLSWSLTYRFRRDQFADNRSYPGLVLGDLQPIPDAEYLPFTYGNQASVCEHQPQPITFLSPTSAAGRRTRTFAEADGRNAQTQIRALRACNR